MHGVRATGISLSDAQLELAHERMSAVLPPDGIPDLRHQDYRLLPRTSGGTRWPPSGMMEHVGRDHLDRYFSALEHHLVAGGLLLNHAIAENGDPRSTIPWLQRTHGGFIRQEIFPDSDLPPLDLVIGAAQRAGFEVLDVEAFRPFYFRTLVEWLGRLERRFPRRSSSWASAGLVPGGCTSPPARSPSGPASPPWPRCCCSKRDESGAARPRQARLVPRTGTRS